jgi:hypothetical protein
MVYILMQSLSSAAANIINVHTGSYISLSKQHHGSLSCNIEPSDGALASTREDWGE